MTRSVPCGAARCKQYHRSDRNTVTHSCVQTTNSRLVLISIINATKFGLRLTGRAVHLEMMQLRDLRQRPEAYVRRTRGGSTDTCISLQGSTPQIGPYTRHVPAVIHGRHRHD